jgi:hypothetical protein
LTDGLKDYGTALLRHFGNWMQPERRQAKGPKPQPRWMPQSGLLYAQVVKAYRRRRLIAVKHRVVFGTLEAVEQVLGAGGRKINTAFVERLNLDIRQRVAAVGRRVNTLCQGEDGLQHQLTVFQVYHNFVLPHASLRQPLLAAEATNGNGSAKRWRPLSARRRPAGRVALRHQRADTGNEFSAVCHRVCERVIAADEQAGCPKIVVGD